MKILYQKFQQARPAIIYLLFYLTWFFLIERIPGREYTIIHMKADDKIPFCEYFIIPYVLWFFYIAWILIYLLFTNYKDYHKCCTFLFTGMTIFLIISTLFPNIHYLRPSMMPRDNIFTQMVSYLYKIDTSTNLWPSIHVYNSLGVFFAVIHNERLSSNKWIKSGCFTLTTLIILSTVFLKQHSLFDVMTGLIMGAIFYVITYHTDLITNLRTKYMNYQKQREKKTKFN